MKSPALVGVGLAIGSTKAPAAAQAAANYFDVTKIVNVYGSASCPSGWKVTGGGISLPAATSDWVSSTDYTLTASYPYSTTTRPATATVTRGRYSTTNGWRFTTSAYTPRVYAEVVN